MTRAADVIAEAREWVGTPYVHQAYLKGVGADCVGLIIGVGLAAGVTDWTPERHKPFSRYARTPHPERMRKAISTFLLPVERGAQRLGDVAWLEWRENLPMHLAILAELDERLTLIHAAGDIGRVVEHDLDALWESRINSWWRYPGLA